MHMHVIISACEEAMAGSMYTENEPYMLFLAHSAFPRKHLIKYSSQGVHACCSPGIVGHIHRLDAA
jgi:hypothetical protein